MEKLLINAIRNKYRWNASRGILSIEDLWDLSIKDLDDVAVALYREVKEKSEISFIKPKPENTELQEKFEIAKWILETKVKEREEEKERLAKKQKKERILEILARKEEEELLNKSTEELKALLEEL